MMLKQSANTLIRNDISVIQNLQYQLLEQLQKNAQYQIYIGLNLSTNQKVLIKIIDIKETQQVQQYQIMAKQRYKNVINIISLEQKDEKLYLVMEFSEQSLLCEFQDNNSQIQQNARYIIKQIANGIKELHNSGLTHMKIKPSNIVILTLTEFNNHQKIYKLCDYGDLLKQNMIIDFYGETKFQAPEQRDQDTILIQREKVDIWAFGIICLRLFNCQFSEKCHYDQYSGEKQLTTITQQDIQQLIETINCNGKFQDLFSKMLQTDPQQRITIEEVLNKLRIESQTRKIVVARNYKSVSPIRHGQVIKFQQLPFSNNQLIPAQTLDSSWKQYQNNNYIEYVSNFNYNFSQEQIKGLNNLF